MGHSEDENGAGAVSPRRSRRYIRARRPRLPSGSRIDRQKDFTMRSLKLALLATAATVALSSATFAADLSVDFGVNSLMIIHNNNNNNKTKTTTNPNFSGQLTGKGGGLISDSAMLYA